MSGITAIPLVTVLATILSVETHHARVDAGLVQGIRPDDTAVVFYMTSIDSERKKVIVNRGVVIEVDAHSSVLRVDSEFSVLPGYSVEFEVPMDRVSPASIPELVRSRLMANRSSDQLGTLIEVMVPEDEFVEQQIVRLIEDRWRRRGITRSPRRGASETSPRRGAGETRYSTLPSYPKGGAAGESESEVVAGMAALVRDWAQAWSDQQVDDYLACYSRGFLPPGNLSRETWEAQRRQRIQRPRFVKLSLEFLESEFIDASRGWIRFRQSYWSNTYGDTVVKKLELILEDGEWRILQESSSS